MTKRLIIWLCCFALLAPLAARADNTADEADVAFRLGNQAFAKRRYDDALAAYFLSNRLVPNKNVLFNIARCYEAMKSYDEAYRYYHDLLFANLEADDLRDVKAALARLAPQVGLVTVTTEPPGADVYIDREDLGSRGRSPQTLAVAPGRHKVLVRLDGMHSAEATVSVNKGRGASTVIALKPIVGTVEFSGSPQGATVRETLDGPALGTIPSALTFSPGQRLLVVTHPGFNPSQVLVTVKGDETVAQKVSLTAQPPPTGKVTVTSNRENALVRVDGRDSGFTPTVLSLTAGTHRIEVSAKEMRPHEETIEVTDGAELKLIAELRYAPPKVRAASKSLSDADEAAASITVITREEILAMGYQSLAEALQAVHGIYLSNDRIYSYLGIRGFSPPGDLNTRVLILYDGHAMNDVWAGQGFSARDLDVDLSEIERIEIVRGPGSALYGTGAFFAVINLVPRDTVAEDKNVEGVVGVGGQMGGKARVTGSAGKEARTALASAAGFQSRGAESTDLQERGVVTGSDGERSVGAGVRARLDGFTFQAKINQRRKQIPVAPLGTAVGQPGTSYTDVRGFAEVRYEKEIGRVTLAARAYFDVSFFEGTYTYEPETAGDDFLRQHDYGGAYWGGGEVRARIKLFEGNQLSVGLEGQYQSVRQAPSIALSEPYQVSTRPRTLLSAYLLDEWRIIRQLSLTLGVRVDKYLDLDALPITPRLGLVARPYASGLTKVVVGQAFRAPNIYELYFSDNNVSQKAAGTLRPETITTFEAEHSHDFTEELRFTVGAYGNLIDQLVVIEEETLDVPDCGVVPNTEQCVIYRNSGQKMWATGAEASLKWQPGRHLFVDVSYSFVKLLNAPPAVNAGSPAHIATGKVLVPLAENYVRLSGLVNYTSARGSGLGPNAGEAVLVNLGLSGELKYLRYFAGVQNLLDARYFLPLATDAGFANIPQYGRTFWLELAVSY